MTIEDMNTTYDVASLRTDLGKATDEELAAHFDGVDPTTLVRWGQRVATPRISRDGVRIVGQARDVIARSSEEQLDLLGVVTPETLRLTIHAVTRAGELNEQVRAGLAVVNAAVSERDATFVSQRPALVARRDLLNGVVGKVVQQSQPWRRRLDEDYSRAGDASSLASSLTLLCDLGDELLASHDAGVVARRKTTRLRPELIASTRELATRASLAAEEQRHPKAATPVSQGQVDLFDGYALTLLEDIVDAFDRAHESDPTIPRMDVILLRNVLHAPSGKKKAQGEATPAPTPGG